jgi:DNA-binding XRE family transcriptional regulator
MDNNNISIFWDKNLTKNQVLSILKDGSNPRFIEFASLLLARTNKPKKVFDKYLTQEIFVNNWSNIKRRMKENKWNVSRIIFWDEIYKAVKRKTNIHPVRSAKERFIEIDPAIKELSDLIREQRIKSGLTQMQLANKSGLSQQSISFVERGYVNISLRTLKKIADALNLKIVLEKALD